jgi:transposase
MGRHYKNGLAREQAMLLPPCVDDYVSADNPVRAIDAFVDSLDLAELGF